MSQIKLLHSGGNGVSIVAPDSNPASDRTLKLPSDVNSTIDTLNRAGNILQVVSTTKTNTASYSLATQSWWSYTDSSLIATITPTSSNNKIMITGTVQLGVDSQQWMFVRLEKNGSRLDAANGDQDGNKTRIFTSQNYPPESTPSVPYTNMIIQYLDTAGDTNSRYYNFGLAHTSGSTRTVYLNRGVRSNDDWYTPQCASTITVMEIAA